MRLLCITDIHSGLPGLRRILDAEPTADVLILGGDLTNFGSPADADAVIDLARSHSPRILAVAGNCDSVAIEEHLAGQGISVHGIGVEVDGVGFFGVSAMPPWTGAMYELTEDQIHGILRTGHAQVEGATRHVLVSHAPPRDCAVDRVRSGAHVGSTSVRYWTETVEPAVVVCGHIHESRGVGRIGTVPVVNCGLARDGHYAVVEMADGAVTVDPRSV